MQEHQPTRLPRLSEQIVFHVEQPRAVVVVSKALLAEHLSHRRHPRQRSGAEHGGMPPFRALGILEARHDAPMEC